MFLIKINEPRALISRILRTQNEDINAVVIYNISSDCDGIKKTVVVLQKAEYIRNTTNALQSLYF